MCDACKAVFGGIADREVRCRTSGCKKTWTWSRSDQLDACMAGQPPPKAPHRMCESCLQIYQGLRDVERPCRRAGCKGTWIDKRGAQLARAVRGKTGDPYPQYCATCATELDELEDRQVPCKTENCTGTWVWTKAAQLAAGVRLAPRDDGHKGGEAQHHHQQQAHAHAHAEAAEHGAPETNGAPAHAEAAADGGEAAPAAVAAQPQVQAQPNPPGSGKRRRRKRKREIRPPERKCQTCIEFLKDKKTLELPCKTCGTPIYWPPESQLQTHLGAWAEPTMCGACKRDATEAARAAQREALRHGGLVLGNGDAGHAEAPAAPEASETTPAPEAPATEAT
jgi:hypothetical protein